MIGQNGVNQNRYLYRGGDRRGKRGQFTPMDSRELVVLSDPDLQREFETDDRGRITLGLEKLRNARVNVVVQKIEDIENPEEDTR